MGFIGVTGFLIGVLIGVQGAGIRLHRVGGGWGVDPCPDPCITIAFTMH